MIFRPYYYFDLGCAAYLIGCGTLGKGAVVDARADDIDTYITFAASKNLELTHVIDTQCMRTTAPAAVSWPAGPVHSIALHESADVTYPFSAMHDDDQVALGNTRVKVLHTPGHSPESVCLVVTDLKRGSEPWFVLTRGHEEVGTRR